MGKSKSRGILQSNTEENKLGRSRETFPEPRSFKNLTKKMFEVKDGKSKTVDSERSENPDKQLGEILRLINAHPRANELISSFGQKYISEAAKQFSPGTALKKFIACLDTFDELKAIDDRMDKVIFEKIIESDLFMLSGQCPKTGRDILWIREGLHRKGCWSVKHNSPKFWAIVRSQLFGFQAAHAMTHETPFHVPNFHFDVAEQGPLDFNLRMSKAIFRLTNLLFPLNPARLAYFGAGQAQNVLISLRKKVVPSSSSWDILCVTSTDQADVYPFVKCPNSIPAYMIELDDGDEDLEENEDGESSGGDPAREKKVTGTQFEKSINGITWMYKQISRDGYHLSAADVYNPQQWDEESETVHTNEKYGSSRSEQRALQAFEKDNDEDEW